MIVADKSQREKGNQTMNQNCLYLSLFLPLLVCPTKLINSLSPLKLLLQMQTTKNCYQNLQFSKCCSYSLSFSNCRILFLRVSSSSGFNPCPRISCLSRSSSSSFSSLFLASRACRARRFSCKNQTWLAFQFNEDAT